MIDLDKLIIDLVTIHARITGIDRDLVSTYLDDALAEQGLRVQDGMIVRINPKYKVGDNKKGGMHTCRQCAYCDWSNQYCSAKDADMGKKYMTERKRCNHFEERRNEQ